MGYYPAKAGTAYELISTAALSIAKNQAAYANQYLPGQSGSVYQLDGLIGNDTMIEAKDYTKQEKKSRSWRFAKIRRRFDRFTINS